MTAVSGHAPVPAQQLQIKIPPSSAYISAGVVPDVGSLSVLKSDRKSTPALRGPAEALQGPGEKSRGRYRCSYRCIHRLGIHTVKAMTRGEARYNGAEQIRHEEVQAS